MEKKIVSVIVLTLLLIGVLTLAFNIQTVKASGTIYIRADGSVEPSTANITTVDNVTYTFTGNIIDYSIVVERDDIIIDGNGYTLQGNGTGYGFELSGRNNVTIQNTKITGFYLGICLHSSSNSNTISGNNIINNFYGISLGDSSDNTLLGNTVTNNSYYGISLVGSSNNVIFHNNFINNTGQVWSIESANTWDNGYPSGGNYWSDHVCTGNSSDGSQPYIIDENNTDHYPFEDPNGWVIPGDINGDEIVDIFDVVIAANAFGSRPGDPNWNPDADLNNDGVIDIFDMVIIGVNYGKRLPL